jgi:hypothetical protein
MAMGGSMAQGSNAAALDALAAGLADVVSVLLRSSCESLNLAFSCVFRDSLPRLRQVVFPCHFF